MVYKSNGKDALPMRQSLKELIKNTILFKYELPNQNIAISKSKISTKEDYCYSSKSNEELSEVIYNAVIEYAFNEYEITDEDFDILHRRALTRKLKFNEQVPDEQKIKYGFYGEVILYCVLHIFHDAPPIIARGHFYNVLENGETKGYDAYHLIDNQGEIELWFGEVKFYANFSAATTGKNGVITNLKKAISDEYLNNNLIAISERISDLALDGSALKPILNEIRTDPDIKIADLSNKYKIKLVYPMLILFNEEDEDYDKSIKNAIEHIETKVETLTFGISVNISLFFILIPVTNTMKIKSKVIEWIRDKKPLLL